MRYRGWMSALPVTPPCEPPSTNYGLGSLAFAHIEREYATPAYRLLETGEIIQVGDQWQDGEGCWRSAHGQCGRARNPNENVYRRPITGGAGLHESATVSQVPPERATWETLLMSLDREEGLKAEIEAAHAACDGPVSREGTDGPRPLAERVSALRRMLSEARYEIPEVDAIPQDDDDGQSVFVGIVCGAAGAIIGALLACWFLALR